MKNANQYKKYFIQFLFLSFCFLGNGLALAAAPIDSTNTNIGIGTVTPMTWVCTGVQLDTRSSSGSWRLDGTGVASGSTWPYFCNYGAQPDAIPNGIYIHNLAMAPTYNEAYFACVHIRLICNWGANPPVPPT